VGRRDSWTEFRIGGGGGGRGRVGGDKISLPGSFRGKREEDPPVLHRRGEKSDQRATYQVKVSEFLQPKTENRTKEKMGGTELDPSGFHGALWNSRKKKRGRVVVKTQEKGAQGKKLTFGK